jgi:hypothetical protein
MSSRKQDSVHAPSGCAVYGRICLLLTSSVALTYHARVMWSKQKADAFAPANTFLTCGRQCWVLFPSPKCGMGGIPNCAVPNDLAGAVKSRGFAVPAIEGSQIAHDAVLP